MIILIHGLNTFNAQEKLGEVIKQFQAKRDSVGLNVVRLDGPTLGLDRLYQETMTQGFLATKKMIVIKNLLENKSEEALEAIIEFIKNFSQTDQDNALVFYEAGFIQKKKTKVDKITSQIFTYLKKQQYTFEFPNLEGIKLDNWVLQRVKTQGGEINLQAARELASLVGSNLWQLANEIDKLVAYKKSQEISVADITNEVKGKFEENIFALTDAVAQADKAKALKLLSQEISNGANEIYLLTMITRQFRILIQIKSKLSSVINSSSDQIAKTLKLHPFVVKKSLPIAKLYTKDQLVLIYNRLLHIDLSLKTSYPNPKLLLNLLIVE